MNGNMLILMRIVGHADAVVRIDFRERGANYKKRSFCDSLSSSSVDVYAVSASPALPINKPRIANTELAPTGMCRAFCPLRV